MTTRRVHLPSGLALTLACQPAGAPPQDPSPPTPASEPAAASTRDEAAARPRALTRPDEIESAIGERVVVVGTAGAAKLGAVVLVGEAPIYCLGREGWPEGVEGQEVEVTGTLARTDRFAARVDDDGAVSQGTQGSIVVIEPCSFHLRTIDAGG
ncbi:MAG: hypothetical protein R3B09_06120 [Nannocystaceae bacterium]